jgi:hypothetical protein
MGEAGIPSARITQGKEKAEKAFAEGVRLVLTFECSLIR